MDPFDRRLVATFIICLVGAVVCGLYAMALSLEPDTLTWMDP